MRHPQIDRIGAGRMGFALLPAVAIAVALAVPGPSRASAQWEYPLLPHVQALAFMPSTPNDIDPTTVVLSSVYSQECWDAGEISVSDPAHVAIRLASCTLMPDSVSGWVRQASLGVLSAGMHSLTVRASIRTAAGDSVTEEITIPFEVVHGTPPPPPPPPSDSGSTLLVGVSFDPPAPAPNQPVSVIWSVLFPFTCMSVTSAHAVDATHLKMTLQQSPGCADTTRRWLQRFDLGVLPAGPSYVALDITIITPDSTTHFRTGAVVYVTDPNTPPPPPIDSLRTTMSATHPNPFRDQTQFSVSLEEAQSAQVMVYDIGGRRVATVFTGLLPAGTSVLAWDGRRSDGSRAAGGIYFYRLSLPGRVVTRRVVLLTTP